MPTETDEHNRLWNSVKEHNETALYQLYHQMYDSLYRYGLHICIDTDLVKDVINALFVEIWEKWTNLPTLENVKGYIFIWFKRKLYKQLKQQKSRNFAHKSILENLDPEEKSYEEILIDIENNELIKEKIRKALDSLTSRQRELIILRFFEDMSFEEIAKKTNTSIRTIYNTLHMAINRLKTELGTPAILLLFLSAEKFF